MSRFGRHFVRIRDLKTFEKKFLRVVIEHPRLLNAQHEALFRYALTLAQMHTFEPEGKDPIAMTEFVDPLRRWMTESLIELIDDRNKPYEKDLRDIAPILALRLATTRKSITKSIDGFDWDQLDAEIRQKQLVLVLGGGGGSGLAHLGTFKALNDLKIAPSLVVGSSMGSIMGMFRCMESDYDPLATALALPDHFDYHTVFKPFSGFSRFGFPGAFHFNLRTPAESVFKSLHRNHSPSFSELEIPLEIVVSGIRVGFELEEERYRKFAQQDTSSSHHAMRSRLKLLFRAVSKITRQPKFLTEVVLGRDELTRDFPVIEAVGFSSAVPGLLHYDVLHDDPRTVDPLETLFERDQLLRMCDGGIVNNVPSRVAWESVQSGTLGTRNALIASFDVFAPIKKGSNMIWIPMQQIAKTSAVANSPYSDLSVTFRDVPSPLQVFVNSYSKLKSIIEKSQRQLESEMPILERALQPLPPYGVWNTNSIS